MVINTGKLSAPGGQITVAAVPGSNAVRISQAGNLLSLEISPALESENNPIAPVALPQLLTGPGVMSATGLTTNAEGQLVLTGGTTVGVNGASTIVSGNIQLGFINAQSGNAGSGGNNEPAVNLLVLSACSTALGDEEAELGFAGLAVASGAKSAVASLWEVSDDGTLGLMTEFYRQLRLPRSGGNLITKADALRRAQLEMLRGRVRIQDGMLRAIAHNEAIALPPDIAMRGDRLLSHPYYWAAFTLIGNPW